MRNVSLTFSKGRTSTQTQNKYKNKNKKGHPLKLKFDNVELPPPNSLSFSSFLFISLLNSNHLNYSQKNCLNQIRNFNSTIISITNYFKWDCLFVCLRMKTSYWFSPFEVDKRPTVSYHTDSSYYPSGTVSLSFIPPDNIVLCDVA